MIKQIAALIIGSFIITITMVYDQQAIQYLVAAHDYVAQLLRDVFSGGQVGNIARELLALLAIPIGASGVAAGLYYLARRHWFPYFMPVVWVIWLVQVSAIVMMYGG